MKKFKSFISLDTTKRKKIIHDALAKSKPTLWLSINNFGIVDQYFLVMYLLTLERDSGIDKLICSNNRNGIRYGLQRIKERLR